jgi:hypothetical protein
MNELSIVGFSMATFIFIPAVVRGMVSQEVVNDFTYQELKFKSLIPLLNSNKGLLYRHIYYAM